MKEIDRPITHILFEQYVTIGDYRLSVFDKDSLWLEEKSGEGMQVWNSDAVELLDKFFKENF